MIDNYKSYNDEKKHTILVVDDSKAIHLMLNKILTVNNYNTLQAYNGKEAIDIISDNTVDLIITDIEMPEMNGFELIKYINDNAVKIPYFMMSTLDMEEYIDMALENNVGNILHKPLEEAVILSEVYKIIHNQELLGLERYLPDRSTPLHRMKIITSKQIRRATELILEYIHQCQLTEDPCDDLKMILTEMLSNAIYHAYDKTDLKEQHLQFDLPEGEHIEVKFGFNDDKFGVGITDFKGKLTKQMILENIKEIFDAEKRVKEAIMKGEDITDLIKTTGRGLYMSMGMSSEYFINLQKETRTEIIMLSSYNDKNSENSGESKKMSLKINEFY